MACKTLRILAWVLLTLLLMLLFVMVLVRTPWGNGLIRSFAESYLQKKLQTEVRIGAFRMDGLEGMQLNHVLLRDRQKDTLLAFDTLDISFRLPALTRSIVDLPSIRLSGLTARVSRDIGKSPYNFQFIIDAFASDSPDGVSKGGISWNISLRDIRLSRISFLWDDRQTGSYYRAGLNELALDLRGSDMDKMRFDADSGWLDGADIVARTAADAEGDDGQAHDTAGNSSFSMHADILTLTNTRFSLSSPADSFLVNSQAKKLTATQVKYDLASGTAGARLLTVDQHRTELYYRSALPGKELHSDPKSKAPAPAGANRFSLKIDSISLTGNSITANDKAYPKTYRDRFDVRHIGLDSLELQASGVTYGPAGYGVKLAHLSFRDQNGFVLRQLRGDAIYSDTALAVSDLLLETRQNRLQGAVRMQYDSPGEMISKPGRTRLMAHVKPAKLRLQELAYFSHDLEQNRNLAPLLRRDISVELEARGTLDKLELPAYRVSTGANILRGSASVAHPLDPDKLVADIRLSELGSTRKELQSLLPPGLIPDTAWAYIPERFTMRGQVRGSTTHIAPDLQIHSSFGDLAIRGYIDNPSDKMKARYDLSLAAGGISLGQILQDTALGTLSGKADINGTGYDPATMVASLQTTVTEAGFRGYPYRDIRIHADMDKGNIHSDVRAEDPNLDLDAELSLYYGGKPENIMLHTDIRQLDLRALGFADSAFAVRGRASLDFPVIDSARIEGNGMVNDLAITMGSRNFFLDTISMLAETRLDSQYIKLTSPLADLEVFGKYSLQAIPGAAATIIENWMKTSGETLAYSQPLYAEINGKIHIADSMAALVPGLRSIAPFTFEGGLDTHKNLLVFLSNIPKVQYRDYMADSIMLAVLQRPEEARFRKAQFLFEVGSLSSPSFNLYQSQVRGEIDKGLLTARILFYDPQRKLRYALPISYVNDSARPYVYLRDTILLNNSYWHVNADNRIYTDPKNLLGSNLVLNNGKESISLLAAGGGTDGLPLAVDIQAFRLESIANILVSDTALLTGVVNGRATMDNFNPLHFKANLQADSLTFMGSRYGNLRLDAGAVGDGKYALDLGLLGEGNDFSVKGWYEASTNGLDLKVRMAPLSLQPAAPFLSAYADSLKGSIRGNLAIRGTTRTLDILGDLSLDTSSLILRMTGAPVQITKAGLHFTDDAIVFDGMTIKDQAGREATVTGEMTTRTITDLSYSLRMRTDRFMVAGKNRYADQLISGPLHAAMLLNVDGNLEQANIRGNINVVDSSEIRYVYRSTIQVRDGDGLIEFFEPGMSSVQDSTGSVKQKKKKSGFKLAVNTDLKLTPSSSVTIVIDEMTGDQFSAKGAANLNFSMAPDGTMQLTGIYEAESGSYNMTIAGIIKKSFELVKGSSITWSGDILKANANLTAMYKVKTDAEELLQDGQSTAGAGKQKLNFEVYMMIRGEILKPDISFRLDMPEKEQSAFDGVVYTRLKQVNTIPSELNKQVMGLLALGSFIADNPFSSLTSSGGNFETQAFSTAGRLLTQELNDFLGDVVKNVDIDVGLDIRDDYTSGSAKRRSDLKVGFAKSFANNRLSVYVGNTFALENENQEEDVLNGLAGDVSVEYLLTTDGRYRLKGYRETEEDLTFNGQMVETGVTFVVVIEFNKLKNAFRNRNKKKGNRA